MKDTTAFDIAFIGHYTQDTIVTKAGTRIVNGGAYFYGASAARRMGLKTAAVTRLAREDFSSFAPLAADGAMVRAIPAEHSTCLKLEYPTDNPDDRILSVTTVASPFEPGDVADIKAGVWDVGASIRGEVSLEVLKAIKATGARIGLDAQGFVRIIRDGTLAYDRVWPEKAAVLSLVDVFKADVVEAEILTGSSDLRVAAEALLKYGDMELVLTHGAGVVVWAGGVFHEAAFTPKSLVGRSGRGDTCLASYLAARISMEPKEATRWAAALTSLKMEAVGPFSGTNADVEKALKERY
jgi:sugar/nucleoside kinase (ribokinase family)